MIVTVTLNPAIDRTMIVENFKLGAVNRVVSVCEDMGGKGINVSKTLEGLNHDTVAIGFIGSKNFAVTQALINKEGITTDFVLVDAFTRTNTKVVDIVDNATTDINESGFFVDLQHIKQLKILVEQYAKKSEVMIFSGSICKGITVDDYMDVINHANQYTKVVLDADGEVLKQGCRLQPYMIKPNIFELQGILSKKLESQEEIIQAAKQLLEEFNMTYVLVSLGEKGSLLVSKQKAWFAKALKVDVKSTVGAGDAMLAGFIEKMLSSNDPVAALKLATACGGLAATKEGTQGFSFEEVSPWIEKVEVHEISE